MEKRPSPLNLSSPSPWVARFASLIPKGGEVLDVACGAGRHAGLFLERGHPVTAVDRDVTWIRESLEGRPGLTIVEADLEAPGDPWPFQGRAFAAIVVANYLHRPLLPRLVASVAEDGFLIYETFAAGQEHYAKPRNPDHLLAAGELLEASRGHLHVVAFEQGLIAGSRAKVVQRLCAARSYGPWGV
jgi:SAM-dependent methyltransferase